MSVVNSTWAMPGFVTPSRSSRRSYVVMIQTVKHVCSVSVRSVTGKRRRRGRRKKELTGNGCRRNVAVMQAKIVGGKTTGDRREVVPGHTKGRGHVVDTAANAVVVEAMTGIVIHEAGTEIVVDEVVPKIIAIVIVAVMMTDHVMIATIHVMNVARTMVLIDVTVINPVTRADLLHSIMTGQVFRAAVE
jgi:hypothetical protein